MPKKQSKNRKKSPQRKSSDLNQRLMFIAAALLLVIVFVIRQMSLPEIYSGVSVSKSVLELLGCAGLLVGFIGLALRHIFRSAVAIAKIDQIFIGLAAAGGLVLALLAFNPTLAPNGDNAEYLINAKSLVERGAVYRLNTPNETYNSLAALGLPALLSPIYSIWGMDIIKMKVLIFLLYVGILPLLYLLFKEFEKSERIAATLALLGWTSPYLVSASSAIMTETPFIFFSVLALFFITKFGREDSWQWRTLVLMLMAIAMTFLVRAIGISMFGALVIYLIMLVPWMSSWQEGKVKALWKVLPFRKLIWLTLPILIAGLGFQLWQQSKGISQAAILLDKDILQHASDNFFSTRIVLGQMIFGEEIYRWFSFDSDSNLPTPNVLHYGIMVILVVGFCRSLYRRNPIALYTVLTMILVIVGSLTPQEMVTMRYNMVLMPFFIYHFYLGLQWLVEMVVVKLINNGSHKLSQSITLLLMTQLLLAGLSNNLFNVGKSSRGYGNAYDDFLQAASWSKENLPEDAYVASAKPRIFYVFSERKGVRITGRNAAITSEYEKNRLDFFKKMKVTHLILDQASGRTQETIFPIVDNNTDKFEMLHIPKPHGTCGIIKVNPY